MQGWIEIEDHDSLSSFMERMWAFHDSCLKEIWYISGASVNENGSMLPLNLDRRLRVLIQRQFEDIPVIEMEFEGLKRLDLVPTLPDWTCEILDATMLLVDGLFYWCDEGGLSLSDIESYGGTVICAEKFRWRPAPELIGSEIAYCST